jgi:hypothetical protein
MSTKALKEKWEVTRRCMMPLLLETKEQVQDPSAVDEAATLFEQGFEKILNQLENVK